MTNLKVSNLTTDSLIELNQSEIKQVVGGDGLVPDIDINVTNQIGLQLGQNLGGILSFGGEFGFISQSIDSGLGQESSN